MLLLANIANNATDDHKGVHLAFLASLQPHYWNAVKHDVTTFPAHNSNHRAVLLHSMIYTFCLKILAPNQRFEYLLRQFIPTKRVFQRVKGWQTECNRDAFTPSTHSGQIKTWEKAKQVVSSPSACHTLSSPRHTHTSTHTDERGGNERPAERSTSPSLPPRRGRSHVLCHRYHFPEGDADTNTSCPVWQAEWKWHEGH